MKGETILCVATRRWASLWRDSQQIMSRLAAQNRILYFEPGRNPDRPAVAEMGHNLPHFFRFTSEIVQKNVIVIPTPSSLPYARRHLPRLISRIWLPLVSHLNGSTLIMTIRRAMQRFNVKSPILWLYEPRDIDLAGKFGEKLVCYYNYDEYPEFTQNVRIRDMLRDYDNRMTQRADVVFATSRGQYERRRKLNPDTYFIPNGVNFELFNRALDNDTPIPQEVVDLKRPIIGFAGWLGYQVDVDLLIHVAQQFPEATLLLVGPDNLPHDERRRCLHSLPNVVFCGQKDVHELPAYLKAFDVALIPYVIGGHTLTVYPLKLHEYLAAGRPVVTTGLPELRAFPGVVRIGENYNHFVEQVRAAISDNGLAAIVKRVALAKQNTWDQRVVDISAALDHAMAAKEGHIESQVHRMDAIRPQA
jgi:glycosyltransferase involved in cell wall biosynthesis